MSTIINVLLLVALGVAAVFMLKKIRGNHKKPERVVVKDPAAQKIYNKEHPKTDEDKSLTIQEKIELSWQFVINITEQVMNRFSSSDQDKLHQAGEALIKNGMQYKHDVSTESKIVQDIVKGRATSKDKDQSMSR